MGEVNFNVHINNALCDLCKDCIDVCVSQCFKTIGNTIIWVQADCTRCESCTDLCLAITPEWEGT